MIIPQTAESGAPDNPTGRIFRRVVHNIRPADWGTGPRDQRPAAQGRPRELDHACVVEFVGAGENRGDVGRAPGIRTSRSPDPQANAVSRYVRADALSLRPSRSPASILWRPSTTVAAANGRAVSRVRTSVEAKTPSTCWPRRAAATVTA